jgi:hypothetical protein
VVKKRKPISKRRLECRLGHLLGIFAAELTMAVVTTGLSFRAWYICSIRGPAVGTDLLIRTEL